MRPAGLAAILLALAAPAASARQARREPAPLESQVEAADIVVVGAATEIAAGGAAVTVESVVWGPSLDPGDRLRLAWVDGTGVRCGPDPGWVVRHRPRGVFLLARGEGGAWGPIDVRPETDLPAIERALLDRPLRLRISRSRVRDDESVEGVLRFRNASPGPLAIPEIRLEGDRLLLGEGALLAGRYEPGNNRSVDLPPREGAIVRTAASLSVPGRSEIEVWFDASTLFDTTRDGYYRLAVSIEGYAPHERVQFSVDEVDRRGEAAVATLRRRIVASGLVLVVAALVIGLRRQGPRRRPASARRPRT